MHNNKNKLAEEKEKILRRARYAPITGLIFKLGVAAFWVWVFFKIYSCVFEK
jgi:hypothetical protein